MMLPFLKCSDSEDHSLRLWTVTEMDLNCCLQKKRFQGPRMTSTCVRAKTQNALKRLDLVPTKWFLISCPLSRMGNQRPLMQTLHDLIGEILKLFWHSCFSFCKHFLYIFNNLHIPPKCQFMTQFAGFLVFLGQRTLDLANRKIRSVLEKPISFFQWARIYFHDCAKLGTIANKSEWDQMNR